MPIDHLILRRAERQRSKLAERCAQLLNADLIDDLDVALKRCDEVWADIIHMEIKWREDAGFLTPAVPVVAIVPSVIAVEATKRPLTECALGEPKAAPMPQLLQPTTLLLPTEHIVLTRSGGLD